MSPQRAGTNLELDQKNGEASLRGICFAQNYGMIFFCCCNGLNYEGVSSLKRGVSFIRVVTHHGGLLSRWSLIWCLTVFKSFQTLRIVGRISGTCLNRLKPSEGTMN